MTSAASEVFYPGHCSCHLTHIRTHMHARMHAGFLLLPSPANSKSACEPCGDRICEIHPPTFCPLSMSDPDHSQEGPWGRKDGKKIATPDLCGAWHLTWPFSCLCFSEQDWGEGSYCSRRPTLQKGLKLGKEELKHLHLGPESLWGLGVWFQSGCDLLVRGAGNAGRLILLLSLGDRWSRRKKRHHLRSTPLNRPET